MLGFLSEAYLSVFGLSHFFPFFFPFESPLALDFGFSDFFA
jgi:hypothetical protein